MTLSATTLLDTWEGGLSQTAIHRALLLLALCPTVRTTTPLANMCLGERDAHLLLLRQHLFGSRLDGSTTCPECGELLEAALRIEDILLDIQPGYGQSFWANTGIHDVTGTSYEVRYRLPTSTDMLNVARAVVRTGERSVNKNLARSELLRHCVLEAYLLDISGSRVAVLAADLTESAATTVMAHMSQTDPQGDVQLSLSCPVCRHAWLALFDIVSFLWAEVDAWAQHLLSEVHALAAGYGWSEADILTMSAWRRQWYLQALSQ